MKKIAWAYAMFLVIFAAFARQTLQIMRTFFSPVFICVSLWVVFASLLFILGIILFKKRWAGPRIMALVFSFLIVLLLLASIKNPEERMHLYMYGLLGFLFSFDNLRQNRPGTFLRACTISLFVAIVDEAFQYILPSRVGDLRDIGFGMIGGVWGASVALILASVIRAKE